MISTIIPSYRNPEYLDLCLRSATENKVNDETEIIVVLDGFGEESKHVVEKYDGVGVINLPENMGMQYALNVGVMNATNPFVFIGNDDNVYPTKWDRRIQQGIEYFRHSEKYVLTFNQVEPESGIFDFVTRDFGRTAESFQYEEWLESEILLRVPPQERFTPNGRIFPFTISKKWYQAVGGFDTFYKSPFWCDVDFFTKLEITKQIEFHRYHGCHFYHFGSAATKNRGDAEAQLFKETEGPAAQTFQYKWGFVPNIVDNARHRGNQKTPTDEIIKGIQF